MSKEEEITINAGTILFSGGGYENCIYPFKYMGQSHIWSDGKIIYLTNDENTAARYALAHKNKIIKKFSLKKDLILKNITDGYMHYEYDELAQFCHPPSNGYYLDWSGDKSIIEIALCNAGNHLNYEGCKSSKLIKDIDNRKIPYTYECAPFCISSLKSKSKSKSKSRLKSKSKFSLKSKKNSSLKLKKYNTL
jgi:hypothetical protein